MHPVESRHRKSPWCGCEVDPHPPAEPESLARTTDSACRIRSRRNVVASRSTQSVGLAKPRPTLRQHFDDELGENEPEPRRGEERQSPHQVRERHDRSQPAPQIRIEPRIVRLPGATQSGHRRRGAAAVVVLAMQHFSRRCLTVDGRLPRRHEADGERPVVRRIVADRHRIAKRNEGRMRLDLLPDLLAHGVRPDDGDAELALVVDEPLLDRVARLLGVDRFAVQQIARLLRRIVADDAEAGRRQRRLARRSPRRAVEGAVEVPLQVVAALLRASPIQVKPRRIVRRRDPAIVVRALDVRRRGHAHQSQHDREHENLLDFRSRRTGLPTRPRR